jgi:glycosyltransferase domain-containing protein
MPTMNRQRFVATTLRSLAGTGFAGVVAICDSSDERRFHETAEFAKRLHKRFAVVHRHLPGLENAAAVAAILPEFDTPYAVYMPDDDILVPRTLVLCAEFLGAHPDYSAVTGTAVILPVDDSRVLASAPYKLRGFEENGPVERLQALLADYCVVHYSLSRTPEFKERWLAGAKIRERYLSAELLFNCLHVVDGKVRLLNDLFVVRQDHPTRISSQDFFDWLTGETWSASVRAFLDILCSRVAARAGLEAPAARQAVKKAFWQYLRARSDSSYRSRFERAGNSPLRSRAREVRWFRDFVRDARSRSPTETGRLSLEALLRPSSPHHADFLPIYETITAPA